METYTTNDEKINQLNIGDKFYFIDPNSSLKDQTYLAEVKGECESCHDKTVQSSLMTGRYPHPKHEDMCYTCGMWTDMVEEKPLYKNRIVINNTLYEIHKDEPVSRWAGYAGRRFNILFNNGNTKVTHNLFYIGEIPKNFRDRFPNEATFISDKEYESLNANSLEM